MDSFILSYVSSTLSFLDVLHEQVEMALLDKGMVELMLTFIILVYLSYDWNVVEMTTNYYDKERGKVDKIGYGRVR